MENEGQDIQIQVPPEEAVGSYANLVGVWHTPHEFALDFCLVQPFLLDGPKATVVSRVRIPPTLVLDLLQSLSQNLLEYENTYGEVRRLINEPEETESEEGGDEQ
jgi:Protein of unknown function (DUF3467)